MNKFIWTDEYSLGIEIIDKQHQHFFDIVNRVYDLLEGEVQNREKILEVIIELRDYSFHHLATEEKYFNQFFYSDMANHMQYHTAFRLKSAEYISQINNTKEDTLKLALEIADLSKSWLTKHILVADKMYAHLFREHGLK
jgi:hemerythrin